MLLECLTCQTIDPCTKEYYKHLDRDEETGNIIFKTELGKYMYNKMKLYLRRHSVIYMMDKLYLKQCELQNSINEDRNNGKNTKEKEVILQSIKKSFSIIILNIERDKIHKINLGI